MTGGSEQRRTRAATRGTGGRRPRRADADAGQGGGAPRSAMPARRPAGTGLARRRRRRIVVDAVVVVGRAATHERTRDAARWLVRNAVALPRDRRVWCWGGGGGRRAPTPATSG